jgi:hypothetical protein
LSYTITQRHADDEDAAQLDEALETAGQLLSAWQYTEYGSEVL